MEVKRNACENKNTNIMREVLFLKTKKYYQQSITVVIACNTNTTLISKYKVSI